MDLVKTTRKNNRKTPFLQIKESDVFWDLGQKTLLSNIKLKTNKRCFLT